MAAGQPHVLQIGRLLPQLETRLGEAFNLHRLVDEADPAAYLAAQGHGFEGLVTSAAVGLQPEVLAALPRLRVISSFGVGLDKLPVAAARARGIPVGHTPDVLNDCVADMAFALLLDVARGVSAGDRFVREGRWATSKPAFGRKVTGARLGVVGLGRIGREIAGRAAGFRLNVRYHSRRAVADVPWTHELSLIELARWADFLVIATSGGEGTRALVDAPVLDALGPEGFLINVARGTVVDEPALINALRQRRIAGAGLDVFENEPDLRPAFLALDNVVLSPHNASGTMQTRQAVADLTFANLQSFFEHGQVRFCAP